MEVELSECWRGQESAVPRSFGRAKGLFLKKKKKSLRGSESWECGRPRFQLVLEEQGALCERFRVQEDLLMKECGLKDCDVEGQQRNKP